MDRRLAEASRVGTYRDCHQNIFAAGWGNGPGGTAKELATMGKLRLQLGIRPLLSRQIVVDRFVVSDPVLALEVDAQGRPNWQFGTATPATATPAQAGTAPGARPQAAPA